MLYCQDKKLFVLLYRP